MKKSIRILVLLLITVLCAPTFFACKPEEETTDAAFGETAETETLMTADPGVDTTETEGRGITESESESESKSEIQSRTETEIKTETETKGEIKLTDEYGAVIEHAHALENGVAAYYTDPQRTQYHFENRNMSVDYDGYYVYYDGNGRFSYAFIIDPASNGRTFRLDTTVPFEGWPEEAVVEEDAPCNVYLDPAAIKEAAEEENGAMGISSARLSQDGSFVSICSTAGKESYFQVYTSSSNKATGQYFVMKFKMPQAFRNFEVFCSTVNAGPTRGDHCVLQDPVYFKGDDSWRVLTIDLSKLNKTFIAAADGSFTATYLRLDLFQVADSSEYQVDLAYVGICDDLNKLYQLNEDMESVMLVDDSSVKLIDPKSGEVLP